MSFFTPFVVTYRDFPEDPTQLKRQLTGMYVDIATAINVRDVAVYSPIQTATGQKFNYPDSRLAKDVARIVIRIPSILNGTTTVLHGINVQPTSEFTRIYGTANNLNTQFVPIPYVNVTTPADGIELDVSTTNVTLKTTTANWTSYSAIIVLEYIL